MNNKEKTQPTTVPYIPLPFLNDKGDIDDFIFAGEQIKLCSER